MFVPPPQLEVFCDLGLLQSLQLCFVHPSWQLVLFRDLFKCSGPKILSEFRRWLHVSSLLCLGRVDQISGQARSLVRARTKEVSGHNL